MTSKRGRRRGPSETREQILRVAREQFASRGYDRTTLRSIADAAAVHQALLYHYFGTKQQLYAKALDLPVDPWEVIARLLVDTPREQFPTALVRHFVSTWRDPVAGTQLRAVARQTFGDPNATDMARAHLETVVIPRFASALDVPEVNVAAVFAHLIGLTLTDSLIQVGQLSGATEDDLTTLVSPAIAQYLTPTKRVGTHALTRTRSRSR